MALQSCLQTFLKPSNHHRSLVLDVSYEILVNRLGFACYVSLSVGLYVVIDEHVSIVTMVPQKSPQLKTFNSFGVESTAVLRQFENALRWPLSAGEEKECVEARLLK